MAIETSKINYGGDMMLFVNASGSTGQPLGFSTNAKFEITLKTRNVGSKDSGNWDESAAGKMSWSASSDALVAEGLVTATGLQTYDELYTMMISRVPIVFVFGSATGTAPAWTVSAVAGKKKFSGMAFITSLSVNAPDGDNASYSINLVGTGALVMS